MLIECPECNNMVSDKAVMCPKCGFPLRKREYNKATTKRMRLPNGFGRITEIKGKNLRKPFRVMISLGKDANGRPIGKLLKPESYFETYNDAYAALVKYNENPYFVVDDVTLSELYEKWLAQHSKKVSQSRVNNIEAVWRYCTPIADMKVRDIRTRDIKYLLETTTMTSKTGKEMSPSPIVKANIKGILSMIFDYAIEYEIVQNNVVTHIKSEEPAPDPVHHKAFTEEEFNLIMSKINTNTTIDMMIVQCYTGLRPDELCHIDISKMNLTEWYMVCGSKTKAGKNRIVPIHEKIRSIIQREYNSSVLNGCQFLFKLNMNTPLTYRQYAYRFGMIMKELGLPESHKPHDCRKQFVTMAKKSGVEEFAIKRIIGHAIKDLTESVYTDRDASWLHEEIAKIP